MLTNESATGGNVTALPPICAAVSYSDHVLNQQTFAGILMSFFTVVLYYAMACLTSIPHAQQPSWNRALL
jgi:hypothetical protein